MKRDLLSLLSNYYKSSGKSKKTDLSMQNYQNIQLPKSTQKRVDNILRYANYQLIIDNARKTGSYLLN
ncbi:hypothetical protein LJC30_00730 [Odoribacter sp. OttesenSCG-928-L07]|nr:hypothetical protein [Odoribacter sp. OttesenSCG-928-L07]MDL2238720.1 hypothetical protein [Bacteroidales bacterium OttesenSCG-928-L14]